MKTVKVVEDDSQKATRALESALESIGQDLQTLYSDTTASRQSSASPEDLLKINRALAEATGKAVAASNSKKQEDVVSVANTGRKVISDLLNTIKVGVLPPLVTILAINVTSGVLQGIEFPDGDDNIKEETYEVACNLSTEYKNLLNLILHGLNNKDIDNNAEVGEAAKRIVASSKSMTQLTERLKGQNYVDPNDPMLIAENELLSAAQSIELAAKRLAELKPRQEVKGQVNQ